MQMHTVNASVFHNCKIDLQRGKKGRTDRKLWLLNATTIIYFKRGSEHLTSFLCETLLSLPATFHIYFPSKWSMYMLSAHLIQDCPTLLRQKSHTPGCLTSKLARPKNQNKVMPEPKQIWLILIDILYWIL